MSFLNNIVLMCSENNEQNILSTYQFRDEDTWNIFPNCYTPEHITENHITAKTLFFKYLPKFNPNYHNKLNMQLNLVLDKISPDTGKKCNNHLLIAAGDTFNLLHKVNKMKKSCKKRLKRDFDLNVKNSVVKNLIVTEDNNQRNNYFSYKQLRNREIRPVRNNGIIPTQTTLFETQIGNIELHYDEMIHDKNLLKKMSKICLDLYCDELLSKENPEACVRLFGYTNISVDKFAQYLTTKANKHEDLSFEQLSLEEKIAYCQNL